MYSQGMEVVLFSLASFVSTYLGGLFSIRFKSHLHAIMAFVSGVLLGVVCFDILPEIIERITTDKLNPQPAMVAIAAGFLVFHILEKVIVIHHTHEGDYASHKHPHVGVLSALALTGHSFMDGVGIGLGFQVSTTVGFVVALAVISHDFTDGMNTVTLMLSNHNTAARAKFFLLLDALAPVVGALSTLLFSVSAGFLLIYLGFFAGFLLYIGASDILPEAHSQRSSFKLLTLTVLGSLIIFIITRLV